LGTLCGEVIFLVLLSAAIVNFKFACLFICWTIYYFCLWLMHMHVFYECIRKLVWQS